MRALHDAADDSSYSTADAAATEDSTASPDASSLPRFSLKFVVISANPDAQAAASRAVLENEVAILNRYFRTASGEALAEFSFASMSSYAEVANTPCKEMLAQGDSSVDTDTFVVQFNSCADVAMRDPHAINIYVADVWQTDGSGVIDKNFSDSYGRHNRGRPFIIFDYARLGHRIQSPEEHEMGHAFLLGHVCVEGAGISSSTNIMATAGEFIDETGKHCAKGQTCDCPFSGGLRDLGFDAEQTVTIRRAVVAIGDALR